MKSRYQGLRGFGTLALVIAWILLILGILAAIGTWLGTQLAGHPAHRPKRRMDDLLCPAGATLCHPGLRSVLHHRQGPAPAG
ncbi:MAG: hypothetical protein V9H69_06135 [Anaerolineae bacterium]